MSGREDGLHRERRTWWRVAAAVALAAVTVAAGVVTLDVARAGAPFALAADAAALSLELAAAIAMTSAGLIAVARRRPFGLVPLALAPVWLVREWASPAAQNGFVFAVGLVAGSAWVAVLGLLAIGYPENALRRSDRIVVGLAFAATLIPAVVRAATFDPIAHGCNECVANPLLIVDLAGVATTAAWMERALGAVAAIAIVGALASGFARSSPARRILVAPVAATAGAVLTIVGGAGLFTLALASSHPAARALTPALSLGLIAVAGAVSWELVRLGSVRRRAARLVADLSVAAVPGRLRDELRHLTHDDSLELLFPLADRIVDAQGRTVADPREEHPRGLADRRVTPALAADGRILALLVHRPGLLDEQGFRDAVARSSALVIEHERMQAELASRVAELREARAELVSRFDGERRRLERDLHDGAQQRMVALLLELRIAGSRHPDPDIDAAIAEVDAALDELRAIAHGLFPPALAEDGLSSALEDLRDSSDTRIVLGPLADGRWPEEIESTAYVLVAETLRSSGVAEARVAVTEGDGVLTVVVTGPVAAHREPAEDGVWLQDRVNAVGGELRIDDGDDMLTVRAELPCGS